MRRKSKTGRNRQPRRKKLINLRSDMQIDDSVDMLPATYAALSIDRRPRSSLRHEAMGSASLGAQRLPAITRRALLEEDIKRSQANARELAKRFGRTRAENHLVSTSWKIAYWLQDTYKKAAKYLASLR